ncbi:hypothetical protein TSOC_008295 [Tetrabaena socialis]|uniref:Uncharacterized protein n=1 Tax=Tetrabaena socialis TaxID=47790 RepID=A0A2J7ZYW9_9CHLO|nr:hypothetical protein TSOC_008295 [Tetrabaena socialis]|eukprot:PNH05471.1 hypothetical protein TSOC_008295 [Tetrabaena socialis]
MAPGARGARPLKATRRGTLKLRQSISLLGATSRTHPPSSVTPSSSSSSLVALAAPSGTMQRRRGRSSMKLRGGGYRGIHKFGRQPICR